MSSSPPGCGICLVSSVQTALSWRYIKWLRYRWHSIPPISGTLCVWCIVCTLMNLFPICSLCSLYRLHPAEFCSWSYTAAFISYNCGILLSELISSDRHGKSLPAILLLLWAVSKWYLVLWFVWPFSRWTWHCFGGFHCPLHPTLKCCYGFFSLHRTVFTSQCVAAILGWVSPARASGTELWAAMCDRCVVRDSKLHRFSWSGQWHLVTLISHRYRRIVLYLF